MKKTHTEQSMTFGDIGIEKKILSLLEKNNIREPSPIQHQAIPLALDGKDLIGIAQTGTGKTFAFGLPMIQLLNRNGGRGLVILPTRELAYQVEESLAPFARAFGINTAVFVGGVPIRNQLRDLKRNPRILIATPGRLKDHLEQGTVTLKEVSILVLDEADRMLDMGFKPQINRILRDVPKERQMMLFSATMPQEIFALAKKEMRLPLRIEVAPEGTTAEKIEQELIIVRKDNKTALLQSLLKKFTCPVLVFTRTKYGAKKVARVLNKSRINAAEIHSNRTLPQRRQALEGFKKGKYSVLVATDIAARGIDIDTIEVVINYDLPDDPADYVHRIGRTGRAGRSGLAISFAMPSQLKDIKKIERLIRSSLQKKQAPDLPKEEFEGGKEEKRGRRPGRRPSSRPPSKRPPRRPRSGGKKPGKPQKRSRKPSRRR